MTEFTIGPLGNWNGTAKVVIKSGDIAEEKVDVICVSVGTSLEHSTSVWKAITRICGTKVYKDAYEKAKRALTHWLSRGEILVVDTSDSELNAKYVFLVVHPDVYHLDEAYRNIYKEAIARGCTSVAIPGLGCGLIGNSVHASCQKACEVLHRTASDTLGSLQLIVFIDIKEKVARQFALQFQAKFGLGGSEEIEKPGSSIETCTEAPAAVLDDDCAVCLCPLSESGEVRELPCKHQFHIACFKEYLRSPSSKKRCPVCLRYFELPLGNQPAEAQMHIRELKNIKLPGHEDADFVYEISYSVPSGIQDASHLRPGMPYRGTQRIAYVPGTSEGTKVLRLLKFAFDRRLIFTIGAWIVCDRLFVGVFETVYDFLVLWSPYRLVGDSITTGARNTVVWNNIHHKTNISGGPHKFGYPDPDYLNRVKEDLAAMGISEDMLPEEMELPP